MKNLIRLLVAIATTTMIARAEDGTLPPMKLRAEWSELHELKFPDWSIKDFLGWDTAADGGSKAFFFKSDGGERFDLVVANRGYWSAQDKKEARQVFIIVHKNRFYRIEAGSDDEKNMIGKLTDAARRLSGKDQTDPKLLTSLAERLKSREPIFKPGS
jgi:hypothetical protein